MVHRHSNHRRQYYLGRYIGCSAAGCKRNSIEGQTPQFKKADGATSGESVLWEPGCIYELPAFVVKNNGNLTLKYKIVISGINGSAKLNEVIDWTMTDVENTVAINGGAEVTLAPNTTSGDIVIVGGGAMGALIINNSNITADFALAMDGSEDASILNNLTVNSGKFTGAYGSPSGYRYKELVIKGGTFTNFVSAANDFYSKDDKIARLKISGGTFDTEPGSNFISDGHVAIPDGTQYKVVSGSLATDETSLQTALNNGGTVYLKDNTTLTANIGNVPDGTFIEGNGKTLTWSNSNLGSIDGNNITVKNVKFAKGNSGPRGIVSGGVNYEGCTFTDLCPYIVPNAGQNLSVIGCTFDKQTLQICYNEGAGSHALAHDIKTVIKDNTFIVNNADNDTSAHGLVLNTSGGDDTFWADVQSHVVMTVNTFRGVEDGSYIAYLFVNSNTSLLTENTQYVFTNNTYSSNATYALNSHTSASGTFIPLNGQ